MLTAGKIASKIIASNNAILAKQSNNLIKIFKDVLGFEFECDTIETENDVVDNSKNLLELIAGIRDKLRANKNYEMSDYIRDELNKLDISISDKKVK